MNAPVATTLLGKSVLREDHSLHIGVYGGLVGRDEVLNFVNQADCLLTLGTVLTDIDDIKVHSKLLAKGRTIHATCDAITIASYLREGAFRRFSPCIGGCPPSLISLSTFTSPGPNSV